ncbi:unnamed protein product [Vitrella brassicaformis CCMP3155]|uniref:Uncharacterized protein n=1 Tax=Vitrella brassicaformis (strain CCMP3155) TaxID=1169540 RepID=A0A0G4G9J0_VITBC|nr:unnamed protein product [Vitrella brassicaformis CCMP3155]|eukprot:CEM25355.1 unnamed protein product [Vitrella brassicaformis CCMP3155]
MLVGGYVAFRRPNGRQDGTLQLFRHNNELRIIRENHPNFFIQLNPPLPHSDRPFHPFSQHHPFTHHAKPHDPPVRHRITWHPWSLGWETVLITHGPVDVSVSSMLKELMVVHRWRAVGGFTQSPAVVVRGGVHGVGGILARSPHAPLNGCSDKLTLEWADGECVQEHVLTSSNDPFIAWISFVIPQGNQDVRVTICTTEASAAGVPQDAPFAQRFTRTAAKVRRLPGSIDFFVFGVEAP